MTDAPDRIIVKWTPKGSSQVLTPASAGRVSGAGANYVRESVLIAERASHEAAVAAARAEGMRAALERVKGISATTGTFGADDVYGNGAVWACRSCENAVQQIINAEASK